MKIIAAPDSFKGSLSARDLCAAIREGVLRVHPHAEVIALPLADGGEGTMENLIAASGGETKTVVVRDPLGRQVEAAYGVLGDGRTAVVEMAQASGLTLLAEGERNPLVTSTYGTGELIRHALDAGHREFIVGLGGSATNDGGTGMLRALGVAFSDAQGQPLPEGGGCLNELARVDVSGLDPRVQQARFLIAGDVQNPLCGPDGASAVFGPQKGATPEMIQQLDAGLARFGEVALEQVGIEMRQVPGGGAAGGLGAALFAFLGANMQSGIEVVMERLGLEQHLQGANLLFTGEGRLDRQTLSGKVIAGVSRLAQRHHVPVIALCGALELSGAELDQLGVTAAFSLAPGPCTVEMAMARTAEWAADRVEMILRLRRR